MSVIDEKEFENIYVACPSGIKTGGTELLHQLVCELNKRRQRAFILCIGDSNNIPVEFAKYKSPVITAKSLEDNDKNLIIIPETHITIAYKYYYIKKCIWWLSVDNYIKIHDFHSRWKTYGLISAIYHFVLGDYRKVLPVIESTNFHLCQSFYAMDWLKKQHWTKNCQILYLTDYINDIFFESNENIGNDCREDIVLYNPAKGREFTKKLIDNSPELKWRPLVNMSNQELRDCMQSSKIYVDFGNHPGKDRIPREAAICGCCVITGMRGAAAYQEDVCIGNEYKFNENDIGAITACISDCITNYDLHVNDFNTYREQIKNEKNQFRKDVLSIFGP